MKLKIISQHKNPLLHRERYEIEIESDSSPKFDEILTQFNKNPELTVIRKVQGKFGTNKFNTEILVYDNKEARIKIETIPKKIKKKREEEARIKIEESKKPQEEAKTEKPEESSS